MKISINCPSYKRFKVETLDYLPQCKVWVDGKEYNDYVVENPEGSIIMCPDGVQGNLCRVRNHILRTEFANGADVVLLIDDDMQKIGYFEKQTMRTLPGSEVEAFLEKYSRVAMELGAKFWGVNVNTDKKCYREYSPFSTVSYIGGPFQCFLKGNDCFYDESLPLKEDYDMTLQQCNKYRIALRVNKYYYVVKQSEQPGGCATYRNLQREKEQLEALQAKWGSGIVKVDRHNYSSKDRNVVFDYNPVIRIPIKGI
jgi:hypothetical protein